MAKATRRTPHPRARILGDGALMLYGVIGDDWDGLDAATVVSEIRSLDVDELDVLLNSPGGLVSEGLAIYHALKTHRAEVTVEISGVAASMGSVIAMAGDRIRIAENAFVMIHDPWNHAAGNAEELRRAADLLDEFGTSLVNIYTQRTGLEEDAVRAMMAEETWLTAEEALEQGFVDEIIGSVEAEAFADLDVSELPGVPGRLVALIREGRQMAKAKAANNQNGGDPKEPAPTPAGQADPPAPPASDPPAADPRPDPVDASAAAQAAVRAERERASDIQAFARKFVGRLPEGFADTHVREGTSVTEFRAAVADELATAQAGNGGPGWIPSGTAVNADERDKRIEGLTNWLLFKSGNARLIKSHTGETPEPGEFRGLRLIDIARDMVEAAGTSTRGMTPHEIAKHAIAGPRASAGLGTRSDFPVLLGNVLHKLLLAAYETAPDQWRAIAGVGSVNDFREHPRYRLGSLPRLDSLLESGEFKQMHFPDATKEAIKADTFGNLIGLSRQAIVNDDLDGFSRLITMLGRAAGRSIEIDLFALLASNAGLGPTMRDGNTLFHATRNNIAGTAAAPSVEAFEAARVLMAQQKDPDGNDFLNLRPAVFAGPIGLGAAARTAVNAEFDFDAETSGNSGKFMKPNVVRDLLSTIVDTPRLAGTRWCLLADPDIAPVLEVAFLEGQESPVIETEEGFDYDGVRWRVRHDYGVGAIGTEGAVTNAGS